VHEVDVEEGEVQEVDAEEGEVQDVRRPSPLPE
jgi:hypothetical protein